MGPMEHESNPREQHKMVQKYLVDSEEGRMMIDIGVQNILMNAPDFPEYLAHNIIQTSVQAAGKCTFGYMLGLDIEDYVDQEDEEQQYMETREVMLKANPELHMPTIEEMREMAVKVSNGEDAETVMQRYMEKELRNQ